MAEQADLGTACQRQGGVLVLQQSGTLGLDLCAEIGLIGLALCIGSKVALEILGVRGGVTLDNLVGVRVQRHIQRGGVLVGNHVANHSTGGQHCGHAGQRAPQSNAAAFFLLCHMSLLLGFI